MDRVEVVANVVADLTATEQAVDEAIARATTLVQAMIGARTALSLSPVSGAGSQAKAMEAISALSTARTAMVECHSELAKDHRRLGYGVYATGPMNKPNEEDGKRPLVETEKTSHLRAV